MTAPYFDLQRTVAPDLNDGLPHLAHDSERHASDEELKILKELRGDIVSYAKVNETKHEHYEAAQKIKNLEIAVPAMLTDIGTAVGWSGTVVDVIDERIDFLGWETASGKLNGLDAVYADNQLAVESNMGHVDALTTGITFVSIGSDEEFGEDRAVVAVEGSSTATVRWDYRKRRSMAGLSQTFDDKGNVIAESLYLEDKTIFFRRDSPDELLEIDDIDEHDMGRCFMTRLVNRPRPAQIDGRSEITRAVRYYTDAALRTMLGMEVNREFYTAPQRYVLNAKPEDFGVTEDMDAAKKFRVGLSVAMGMINIVPGRSDNTEGDPVSVVEMKPAPPTPYIEQVKAYSVLMSAETGMPVEYFGFTTDNPPSADSIRQREYRLVKRASRRMASFGAGWREVGILAMLARDGEVDTEFVRELRSKFADPSTPTRSATADELQKTTASGILVPTGRVAQKRYGLSDAEILMEEEDRKKYEEAQAEKADLEAERMAKNAPPPAPGQPPAGGKPSPTKAPAKTTKGSAE